MRAKHRARTEHAGRTIVALMASLVLVVSSALAVTASASTPGDAGGTSTSARPTTTSGDAAASGSKADESTQTDGASETTSSPTAPTSTDPAGSDSSTAPSQAGASKPKAKALGLPKPAGEVQPMDSSSSTPVVSVTKTLVKTGPFNPGDEFQYRIQYACSSLETACPNAEITDTIPGELDFVTNTTTGDPSTITYDPDTHELKVVFTSIVDGDGTPGLIAGSNGQLLVSVKFPAGTPDRTVAHNCADITATGATKDESCVDAESLTTPAYGVSLDKRYTQPFTGDTATSGVQGTGATTTLDLTATVGGNQAAKTVTVVDPDPDKTTANDPFDAFNLTSLDFSSLANGVQATVTVLDASGDAITVSGFGGPYVKSAGSVSVDTDGLSSFHGISVAYTCKAGADPTVCVDGRIPAGTDLDVKAGLQLRDTLRSDPNETVQRGSENTKVPNRAKVTAAYPGQPDQTDTDTADYTVVPQTATVSASKTISPSSAQEKSGADVTMTVGGKNTGNIAASSMTVTDPDPTSAATPFDNFTFKKFNALTNMPTGVTAKVQVLVNGEWTTVGSGLGTGDTPDLGLIDPVDVQGVKYLYTGTIAPNTEIKNSFVTTLKDSTPAGTLKPANCDTVSMTIPGGGSAGQDQACATFTVTAISTSITAGKSFNPTSGVAHTNPKTTVTLSGKNGSNVPISSFVLVDPGTGSGKTFDYFDFTGFGALTAPSGTTWTVEVYDGTTWKALAGNPYAAGVTPPLSDLPVSAANVQGVRYTLAGGTIPAKTTALSTTVGLQLRDTKRGTQTAIDEGLVHNCATASSTGIDDASDCANYTITRVNPGTGVGVGKNIVKGTVVQNTGEATNVTLTGKNGANVPVDTLVLEDSPDTAPEFWNSFAFNGFGSTSRPTGTTSLLVEYYDGSSWQTVGSYPGTGNVTPSLPGGVTNADVRGVRYTWTGTIAATATVTANFSAKVKDGVKTGTVKDCVQQTYSGGLVTHPVTNQACDSITITAQSHTVSQSKSFSPNTGTVGLSPTTTATLKVTNTSNVPLERIVVTDPDATTSPFDKFDLTGFGPVTLPNNVQVTIEANDGSWQNVGTYTSGQTVTIPTSITPGDVTAVRLTFAGTGTHQIPANSAAMSVGVKLQLRDTVRGTSTAVDEAPIKNCFATAPSPDATLSGDPCDTYTPEAQSPGVSAAKTWSPASGVRDKLPSSTITIKGRNSGNVPVDALVLQDPAFTGSAPAVADTAFEYFDVTGFTGLVLPQGANQVQIDVLDADGQWHNGTPASSLPTATGGAINGVALGDIVGVRATFSNSDSSVKLPVVTNAGQTGNVGISVTLRQTLRSSGEPIVIPPSGNKVVDNQSSALVVYQGTPRNPQNADAKYTITGGSVKVTPDKSLYPAGSSTTVNPNQTLIYQLAIANRGDRNLVAPVVLDKFDPDQLSYDATQAYPSGSYQLDTTGTSLTGAGLTVDTSTPGQVRFTFADGDYLAPGQTAYLRVVLTTKPGLPAGTTIDNEYGITWDVTTNGPVACSSGADSDFDGDDSWCTDDQPVKVQKAESMASLKQIKGDDVPFTNVAVPGNPCPEADGYTYYPCIAHTHPGGIFDYKLNVTVSGNVSIDRARAIDVLPHIGDTGVLLTGQSRDSEWTPTMQSAIDVTGLPAGASYTLYYATTYTPGTDSLSNHGGAWGSNWSATPPSDLSTVKSIGIDVVTADGTPLAPAATFTLHWKMLAPPVAPGVGSITWNSFGFTGEPTDGSGWLLPAEPRKVGIDLSSPSVEVSKTTTGGDGTFGFTLTPIDPAGDPMAHEVTTTGGAGSYTWGAEANLTAGGTYKLAETPQDGWESTFEQCTSTDAVTGIQSDITPIASDDGSVTFVAPVDGEVNCSFSNTKRPEITVTKTATGDGGDFSFTLTPTDPAGAAITKDITVGKDSSASAVFGPKGLTPGDYTIVEAADSKWVSDFTQCTDADGTVVSTPLADGRLGASFHAAAGAELSCSFTNTKRPGITVTKTATGGDGSFHFELTPTAPATGGGAADIAVADGATGSYTWGPDGLTPGGTYTLTETVQDEWISTFEGCTGLADGDLISSAANSVTFTADAGAAVNCSFTNIKRPQITIGKTTLGGSDGTFLFVLQGTGGSAKDVAVSNGTGTATWGPAGLEPGTYTLYEDTSGDVDANWVAEFKQCVDSHSDGITFTPVDEAGKVGVTFAAEPGADISCSVTNTKRPTIEVQKTSVGGDGTFEFTLTGDGGSAVPVSTQDGSGSYTWGPAGLTPGGTYTLSETVQDEWVSTFDSCTGVTPDSHTDSSVTFTATAGADISCSFTNTKRPTIEVQKTSVGGDGDFAFTLTGDGGSEQTVSTTDGSGSYTWGPAGLTPGGTYTLSEAEQVGWTGEFSQCTANGAKLDVTADGLTVTFVADAGADITCSFVNTKIQVLPTSQEDTPPPTAKPSQPSPSPQPSPTDDTIAYTGVNTVGLGWVALVLLLGGGLLLVLGTMWRRRPGRH